MTETDLKETGRPTVDPGVESSRTLLPPIEDKFIEKGGEKLVSEENPIEEEKKESILEEPEKP